MDAVMQGGATSGHMLVFTVYGLQFTVYGLQFTVYGLQFTVYGLQFTVYGLRFTVQAHGGAAPSMTIDRIGG